jgi:hypothetical protein
MDDPGPWHHVMNRAVARRPLFQNRHDVRLLRHRRVPPTWTPPPAERTRRRVSLQRRYASGEGLWRAPSISSSLSAGSERAPNRPLRSPPPGPGRSPKSNARPA